MDLRPYKLKVGNVFELPTHIADILIAWGYARVARAEARPTKKPRPRGRK